MEGQETERERGPSPAQTTAVDNANYARFHQLVQDYSSRLEAPTEKLLKIAVDRLIQTLAPQQVESEHRGEAAAVLGRVFEEVLTNDEKTMQQKTVETMLAGTRWSTVGAMRPIEIRGGNAGPVMVARKSQSPSQSPVRARVVNANDVTASLDSQDVTKIVEVLARQRYQESSMTTETDSRGDQYTQRNGTAMTQRTTRDDSEIINEIVHVAFREDTRFERDTQTHRHSPRDGSGHGQIGLPGVGRQLGRAAQRSAAAAAAGVKVSPTPPRQAATARTPTPPMVQITSPSPPPPSTPLPFGGLHWIDLRNPDPSWGFGFSVGGGVGNETYTGDSGIYVTKITEDSVAARDGRLAVGDKLLCVRVPGTGKELGSEVEISMENRSHEDAVNVLRKAGMQIRLLVEHRDPGAAPYAPSSPQGQGTGAGTGFPRQFEELPRDRRRKASNSLCCC